MKEGQTIADVLSGAADWVVVTGDCLQVLPTIPAGSVGMVFTSPPYNLGGRPWSHLGNWKPGDGAGGRSKWRNGSDAGNGIQYSTHKDSMPWPKYVAWQQECVSAMWRAIGPSGAIFYNHKPRVIGAKLWTPLELVPDQVVLRQIVIWARSGGMNFNPTAYLPTHEWIVILAKEAFRLRDKAASGAGDVWYIAQEASPDHPAPFPLALPTTAIETTSGDLILDPFTGSGTTGVAAIKTGRRFIGIEIDAGYADIARRRIREATPTLFAEVAKPQQLMIGDAPC